MYQGKYTMWPHHIFCPPLSHTHIRTQSTCTHIDHRHTCFSHTQSHTSHMHPSISHTDCTHSTYTLPFLTDHTYMYASSSLPLSHTERHLSFSLPKWISLNNTHIARAYLSTHIQKAPPWVKEVPAIGNK